MTDDRSPLRCAPEPVLVERLDGNCPLFRYRVTCGDLHAVGPTEEAAMTTLERVLGGAS